MPTDRDRLLALKIPERTQTYAPEYSMLYALSLGLGENPTNLHDLNYVYEQNLAALPTMGVVLAHPGFWPRDLDSGLDWVKIVHASQDLVLHRPLKPSGKVIGRSRILDVIDKGRGKGALVFYQREIFDAETNELICTSTQTMFCRGDGGVGGIAPSPVPHAIPDRPADFVNDRRTLPQTALLYRLVADRNPLHADPELARKAGFDRPILHGLAAYGVAGIALLREVCDNDPARLASMSARFTSPVFPGDTLRTEIWRDGDVASFRVWVLERNLIAMDNGRAEMRAG